IEVGEGPGETKRTVVAAHREDAALESAIERRRRAGPGCTLVAEPRSGGVRVETPRFAGEPSRGARSGLVHARPGGRARGGGRIRRPPQLGGGPARRGEPGVEAVEQRTRAPPQVPSTREGAAGALRVTPSGVAARARVRGQPELETCGKARRRGCPRDRDD